jgi:hypothetical protein
MSDHGEHVAALFEAAVSLDPAQRSAFLDRACGDEGSLRQEVEELLHADAAAGSFLKHPVFDLPTADDGRQPCFAKENRAISPAGADWPGWDG